MAENTRNFTFGGSNPVTAPKTDDLAKVAWNAFQILKSSDLNGFIQWCDTHLMHVQNEVANAVAGAGLTIDPTNDSQLAEVFALIRQSIDTISGFGPIIGAFWFGLAGTDSSFEVPAPTSAAQNYYDFATNTPYTANADLSGWTAGSPITPPTDHDARVIITSKFWDITDANVGGVAYWSYTLGNWSYYPTVQGIANDATPGLVRVGTGSDFTTDPATGDIYLPPSKVDAFVNKLGLTGASNVPVGTIIAHAAPGLENSLNNDEWLLCDGRVMSATLDPELFAVIGTTYGSGILNDGSQYNLPDFQGVFLRGYKLNGPSAAMGELQEESLPNITGSIHADKVGVTVNSSGALTVSSSGANTSGGGSGNNDSYRDLSIDASLSNPAYGRRNEVAPANFAVKYFIKAK